MGLVGGGAWAERLVTHEREALAMPAGLSFTDAAAIPEAFTTAFDALVLQGGMRLGTRTLIHAVASGVGTAALQLARVLGAHAIGTGRNAQKLERAKALGLPHAVLVAKDAPRFADEVKALSPGGVDLALDLVGGDWVPETLDALAPQGTLMLVGLVAGASAEVPLRAILGKRLRVIGTTLRARPLEEKIAVARELERRVVPLFGTGALKPVVDAVLPMTEVSAALSRLASNETFGKLVLTW
jgi:NADPH:quinone reductase-like Zn-dependent oxidoreductase